ncbi:MAG: hypothetical protein WC451_04755 [Patescibacteria group bacterium]
MWRAFFCFIAALVLVYAPLYLHGFFFKKAVTTKNIKTWVALYALTWITGFVAGFSAAGFCAVSIIEKGFKQSLVVESLMIVVAVVTGVLLTLATHKRVLAFREDVTKRVLAGEA